MSGRGHAQHAGLGRPREAADQWTRSGLVAVAMSQDTPPGRDGSVVTSLKSMCHGRPAQMRASSFTPAVG